LGEQEPVVPGGGGGHELLASRGEPGLDDREQDGVGERDAVVGQVPENPQTMRQPPRAVGIGEDRLHRQHPRVDPRVVGEPSVPVGGEDLEELEVVTPVVGERLADVEVVPAGGDAAERDRPEHAVPSGQIDAARRGPGRVGVAGAPRAR
jgi:hypothetical protein